MKTVLALALLLISFALPTAWPQQKLEQNTLAISDVTVIDATGAPAKSNMGVRDMAADLELLKRLLKDINEGKRIGPRIIAGQMVDGPMPVWPGLPISISDEVSARKTAASVKDRGADFIKVYSLIPRPAYFALADEAKKRGITFAGHVPVSVSAFEASDAGQKSIEHLEGILRACSAIEPELMKTIEEALKGAKRLRLNENIIGACT